MRQHEVFFLILTLVSSSWAWRVARRFRRAAAPDNAKLVIAKLGGSAITNKSAFETLNAAALAATAEAVASSTHTMVLLHGAGSFGHFQARKFGVSQGSANENFSWAGFAATRCSVTRLNGMVIGALTERGIAAV